MECRRIAEVSSWLGFPYRANDVVLGLPFNEDDAIQAIFGVLPETDVIRFGSRYNATLKVNGQEVVMGALDKFDENSIFVGAKAQPQIGDDAENKSSE